MNYFDVANVIQFTIAVWSISDVISQSTKCSVENLLQQKKMKSLQINDLKFTSLSESRKSFSFLKSITNWETFWEHIRLKVQPSDLIKRFMTKALSWPFTLAASLCTFNMDRQKDV